MAENLGVQFFVDAKAQYESAGKWRWVVVALLAYLHLELVVPFTAATREMAVIDRQLAEDQAAEVVLTPVLTAAEAMAKRVKEAKDHVSADLKSELVERFRRLSSAVNALATLDPTRAAGSEGAALFAPPVQQQMQQQQQQQQQQQVVPEDPSALAPMSAELRRQIAGAARAVGAGDLPWDMQTYIEFKVIEPAFTRANQAWAMSGLAIAQDGAAAISRDIAKAKTAAPGAATQLEYLAASVNALGNEARRLTFVPPADSTWWRTVSEKEATILSITSGLAARVGDLNSSQAVLQALSAQIAELVSKTQQATKALSANLAELNKQASDLQSQLGEIGAPLKVVSFKLSEIAPLMPMIIAAALATLAVWTALSLRRMALAAELVDGDADRTALRKWLHAVAGGSRIRVAGMELVVAMAAAAWVLVAARDVAPLAAPFWSQTVLAAIAVVVVTAARVYRWRSTVLAISW